MASAVSSVIRRWAAISLGFGLAMLAAACSHTEPFAAGTPPPLGPPSGSLPRQLTFNPGDDRSPAVTGDGIIYSRYDLARGTTAQCLAILPVEGGTLRATFCPPVPPPPDSLIGTWLEPATSPSGRQVAFIWQRGYPLSTRAWTHHLTVAPVDSPAQGRQTLIAGWASDQRFYNSALKPTWIDEETVRFLAAYDFVFKVKGGGADRFTDTLPVPRTLMDLRVADGTLSAVLAGDSVIAYAPATDGGTWVVKEWDPTTLRHLDAAGALVAHGAYFDTVRDLAEVDGRVLAATGDTFLTWLDPATGETGSVAVTGPARRLTPAGGRRVVAEVELDAREFGAPAHLWLLELPQRTTR
jgi:hypothetical protein